jgi:UDP-N-acetylglucosamine 2-epimerase
MAHRENPFGDGLASRRIVRMLTEQFVLSRVA